MRSLLRAVTDLIYPDRCPACDAWLPPAAVPGLCGTCAVSLYPLGVACPVCAEPQEALVPLRCRPCRRDPPPFRRIVAPWRYGGELAVAVRRMKYGGGGSTDGGARTDGAGGRAARGRADLLRPLASMLRPTYASLIVEDTIDVVIPVPLYPRRLRDRGFSQAHELLRALASRPAPRSEERRGPARLWDVLVRERPTDEQAGLSRAERLRNVAGAFSVRRASADRILGKRVLLIDDVVTTGATVAACSRALIAAGAGAVSVLALARAEG